MAVRFDASGDRLYTTANPPSASAYTICGWAVLDVDRNDYAAICSVEDGLTNAGTTQNLVTDADGTTIRVFSDGGFSTGSFAPGVGVPFFWSMTATSTGANGVTARLRTFSQNTLTSFSRGGNSFTPTHVFVGNDSYSEWWNGRIWNVKQWNRSLTEAELLVESYYQRPMFPASLNFWWPLHSASDTADRSGNGRNPTVGGTLTTQDGPVNLWVPRRRIILPAAASGGQTLSPSLYTNTQTFYTPIVGIGAVTLTPALFTNSQTFYEPTITTSYTVSPGLLTNSQTFYVPTISVGAVTVEPGLLDNENSFYAATISQGGAPQELSPNLLENEQSFFGPTITTGVVTLSPLLLENSQEFYSPSVSVGGVTLTPELLTNESTFFDPVVSGGSVIQPPLLTNNQTFFAPAVSVGEVEILPSLVANQAIFYGPTVTSGTNIQPPLLTNQSEFFALAVETGEVVLSPQLLTNGQTFYPATIIADQLVLPPLLANENTFYPPEIGDNVWPDGPAPIRFTAYVPARDVRASVPLRDVSATVPRDRRAIVH